ncbi:unnamed protein product [Diabrotica balteata]|uniref:THAP-type domain-containing protein n=1 Tax=Diabrotica balteata TaxID=107213 RepID=A0A9N9SUU0_DIABA|nr:unnamed protein product [Diabrotica balteata]
MWLSVFGLNKEHISKNATVCSEHFKKHDLIIQPSGRVILRKGTVPINIYHKSPEPSSTNDMENKETASSSIDKDDFYGRSKRLPIMDIIEKTLSYNNKLKQPQPNKNVVQNENTEEVNYVNIHEIHVNKVIEKKLGTNHFVLLNYELKPIIGRLGLLGEHSILFVTFLNQIGSKEHLQFFVKYFPFAEFQAQFAEGIGAFEKEALVYKLFKEFSKEGITQASYVVPYCYLVAPKKYFILNDLNTENYQSLNKHICLEYDVIIVVLQALAQLHSSSIAYEEKLKKSLLDLYGNDLEETFFNERKGFPNVEGVESCIKCIVDEIKLFNFPK